MQQLKCNAMKNVRAGRFEILLAIIKICCKQLHIHKQGESVFRSSFNKLKFRQELRDIQSARQICSFVHYDVPVKSGRTRISFNPMLSFMYLTSMDYLRFFMGIDLLWPCRLWQGDVLHPYIWPNVHFGPNEQIHHNCFRVEPRYVVTCSSWLEAYMAMLYLGMDTDIGLCAQN